MAITEKKTHEEHLEMAKEIVDGFAKMGMGHREAESILRLAQEELRSRRSDEIISSETPSEGKVIIDIGNGDVNNLVEKSHQIRNTYPHFT